MKRLLAIIFILILSLTLTSCSHIEDTNGPDDYSLVKISDEEILGVRSASTKIGAFESQTGRTIKVKVSKFSGVENLQSFKTTNSDITFTVSVTVTSGNFKAVLVQEGKIIHTFNNNASNQVVTVKQGTGTVSFYVAGESAKYNITLEYDN